MTIITILYTKIYKIKTTFSKIALLRLQLPSLTYRKQKTRAFFACSDATYGSNQKRYASKHYQNKSRSTDVGVSQQIQILSQCYVGEDSSGNQTSTNQLKKSYIIMPSCKHNSDYGLKDYIFFGILQFYSFSGRLFCEG